MSKHLEAFKRLHESREGLITLTGDLMIVEKLPVDEAKTAGGIILQSYDRQVNGFGQNMPLFYRVLMTGEGYYNTTTKDDGSVVEETVPLDVEPGDIVLLGTQSVKPISKFGPIISDKDSEIGIARAEEVQIRFHGEAAYAQVHNLLKGAGAQ